MKLDYSKCPLCGRYMTGYFDAAICIDNGHNISYDYDSEAWYYGYDKISEDDLIRIVKLKAFL